MSRNQPTSLTLLERLRSRDAAAWERLTQLYGPLVRHWCGRLGVRDDEADDVAQEVFAAVAVSLGTFRREGPHQSFRAWLRGVTRNKLLDHFRRRNRQPGGQGGTTAHDRLEEVADPDTDLGDDPPEQVGGLYRRALDLVRGEFEGKTWQMFWRVAVDNHPAELVATEMGVSSAAVRMAKSRVLRRLKEEVGDLVA
jgi:RNA polymerase sigma-70 factor (ECF subfamily)